VHTLSGAQALTKTFTLDKKGKITKTPYPHLNNFTSTTHTVNVLRDLYIVIKAAANAGHCLLKGELSRELSNESRAGTTESMAETEWICLDLDGTNFKNAEEFIKAVPVLHDVSYIVQYSASYGITMNTMGCHIFMLLSGPMKANIIKLWLKHLNLDNAHLKGSLKLTKSNAALSWPLDISCCQNDKLIYIAPPHLGKGVKNNFEGERINMVVRDKSCLDIAKMGYPSEESLNKQIIAVRNELRVGLNLPPIKHKIKNVNGLEIQPGMGEVTVTGGPLLARGHRYFNLNGGDSWGYYHPENNFEYLHNFKGEPAYLIKEIMPEYYKQCVAERSSNTTAGKTNKLPFVFRDLYTASFWNGYWDATTQRHELYAARNEKQLEHFMLSNNKDMGDYVPVFKMIFNPNSDTRLDLEEEIVNTWQPSPFFDMKLLPIEECQPKTWPTINLVFRHAIGDNHALQNHWHNWMAFIIQYREKTLTSWLWSGTQGTGKGFITNHILRPIFEKHLVSKHQRELKSQFNSYLRTALLAVIDELDITKMDDSSVIDSDLKNFITEPYLSIRGMHQESVQVKNYTNFIFNSNMYQALNLPANDRRFNIGERQEVMLPIIGGSFAEMKKIVEDELPRYFSYLAQIEVDVAAVSKPFNNAARAEMIDLTKTTADMVASSLLNGKIQFLLDQLPDQATMDQPSLQGTKACAYNLIVSEVLRSLSDDNNRGYHRLSRDELLTIFDYCLGNMTSSPTKFTQYLNHKGIKLKPVRFNKVVRPGIELSFDIRSEDATKLMEEYFPNESKKFKRKNGTVVPIKQPQPRQANM
jgi:hypothetical protein